MMYVIFLLDCVVLSVWENEGNERERRLSLLIFVPYPAV